MRNRQESPKSIRRRLEVESILSKYPDVPADEVRDLVHWFKREATPLEIARFASDLTAQDSYRQFREAYIGKPSPAELAMAAVAVVLLVASLAVGVAVL